MEERFKIVQSLICTFILKENGLVTPNENYSIRLCVIDEEKEIAVDVKHKLQYHYIRIKSGLYMQKAAINYIKNNKRATVYDCQILMSSLINTELLQEAKSIITNLKNGKMYPDGNQVLTNEEFLERINNEEKENQDIKVKKIGKKQK